MVRKAGGSHALYPFPDGWYLIAPSEHLQAEQLIGKTWMGQEIVAWRDGAGTVCVADAFCPHLGSHLGPESGGCVRGGNLVCPFHGFEFDVSGRCAATPQAPPPKSARLNAYPVQEAHGFIFAYWDHAGRAPQWRIPDSRSEGWNGRVVKRRRLRSHPQTTTENSVDFGHLSYVHGYQALKQLSPTIIEGPVLTAFYSFDRHLLTRGLRPLHFLVDIEINVWGLGISMVNVHSPTTGLRVQQWVLATPVDGEMIDLWLVVDPKSPRRRSGITALPTGLVRGLVARIALLELNLDVAKDVEIWSRQRYVADPVLSKGDHDVYRFRRYCEQFYPPRPPVPAG